MVLSVTLFRRLCVRLWVRASNFPLLIRLLCSAAVKYSLIMLIIYTSFFKLLKLINDLIE